MAYKLKPSQIQFFAGALPINVLYDPSGWKAYYYYPVIRRKLQIEQNTWLIVKVKPFIPKY